MTRRKKTGPAGKREPRDDSGVALFNEKGDWIGKFSLDVSAISTPAGLISVPGTKAHRERAAAALKWIIENRPDLIEEATKEEVEEDDGTSSDS